MQRGSEKQEEVMEAHKGAGRATEWVSQPRLNFSSLTMKEEWVANIKINKYSSVPSGFFGFSGSGFFLLHEHLPSKKKLFYIILIKHDICLLTLQLQERNPWVWWQCQRPKSRYLDEVRLQIYHHAHFWTFYTTDFPSYPSCRTMLTPHWASRSPRVPCADVGLLQCHRHTTGSHQKVYILQCSNKLSYTTKIHKIVQFEKYHFHKYHLLQIMSSFTPV